VWTEIERTLAPRRPRGSEDHTARRAEVPHLFLKAGGDPVGVRNEFTTKSEHIRRARPPLVRRSLLCHGRQLGTPSKQKGREQELRAGSPPPTGTNRQDAPVCRCHGNPVPS
jgi:hypothetical protein